MALQFSNADKKILLRGRGGSARDVMNQGHANFLIGVFQRGLFRRAPFNSVAFLDKGLFWEEDERLQRCVFQFRITGSANIAEHLKYLGREGTDADGRQAAELAEEKSERAHAAAGEGGGDASGGGGGEVESGGNHFASGFFNHDSENLQNRRVKFRSAEEAELLIFRNWRHEQKVKRRRAGGEKIQTANFMDLFQTAGRGAGEKSFRFMLSPENAKGVPMMEFTRRFMEKLEREIATRLAWVAIPHYDTGHPHVHIVVRGKDEFGNELFIRPPVLFKGCRIWAREIATEYQGHRRDHDIINAYSRDAVAERFTHLDRMLLENAKENYGVVVFSMFHSTGSLGHQAVSALERRLNFLAKLGLAKKLSPGRWRLSPDLHAKLRDTQIQKDIVRRISMRTFDGRNGAIEVADEEVLGKRGGIFGKIIYRDAAGDFDERAIVYVEDGDGKIFAVHLSGFEIKMPGLRAGNFCSVAPRNRYSAIDRALEAELIAAPADQNAGRAKIAVGQKFMEKHGLKDLVAVKRRLRHFAEFGACVIPDDAHGEIVADFEPDAAIRIRTAASRRRSPHTIVAEGEARAERFNGMAEGLGMNFLDRFLMHQTDMSSQFRFYEGGVMFMPHLAADETAFAQWSVELMDAVCRRIEFHHRNGRIWLGEPAGINGFQEPRYAKDFSNVLWAEGAEFSRLTYESAGGAKLGQSRIPEANEELTGTVHADKKTGMVFIAERGGKTCVVLPLIAALEKHAGKEISMKYPALFARNRQARDFYIDVRPAGKKQRGGGERGGR